VLTGGCLPFFRRPVPLHPQFPHQPLDVLAVDLEALAPQLAVKRRDP